MKRQRLHQKVANPYYIYAPNYRETSSGICVMHYLCHALNIAGHEAYVTGCNVVNPQLRTPILTPAIMDIHKRSGRVPVTVYPEVVNGNPLDGTVVVRYILNREGFLSGQDMGAAESDLFFYYAEDFRESASDGSLLMLPVIDSQLFCAPDYPVERKKSYLYLHRYPLEKIDFQSLPPDIELLTFKHPKSLNELAVLFKDAAALYTYEISTTCTIAMLCGCPVIYFKGENIQSLPFTAYVGDAGAALHDEPGGLERARATVGSVHEIWLELEDTFWDQLEQFIDTTQQASRNVEAMQRPRLESWLAGRELTPVQRGLLASHRDRYAYKPGVQVIVLDFAHDSQALSKTLLSLDKWQAASDLRLNLNIYGAGALDGYPVDVPWQPLDAGLGERLNEALRGSDADWFVLLTAGDEFVSSGTLMLEQRLLSTEARMIYGDAIHVTGNHQAGVFRPDINLDLLLSLPVISAAHWWFRREAVLEAGGFNARLHGALEFDLILRMIEEQGLGSVEHIAEPLIKSPPPTLTDNPDELAALGEHLARRGYVQHEILQGPARHYHVQYRYDAQPLVSIVIPSRDQLPLLQRCVESILEKTRYFNYEVLIVDNSSQAPETLEWLMQLEAIGGQKIRVLRDDGPFNLAAMHNLAAAMARGEYLVLLENDTAVIREDWLEALLNHALRPEVGIVGAKLLFPNGTLQHAGMIAGLNGPAGYPFSGMPGDTGGYMQRVLVDQNYSVVSGACLMIRKSVYDDVGGLDETHFQLSGADIDLCLKVRASGYLTVWTPHAVLMHEGGSGLPTDAQAPRDRAERRRLEEDTLYAKWLPVMAADPAYNRNLSLRDQEFNLEGRVPLSWRPLPAGTQPRVLAHPADHGLSGLHRIVEPFRTLQNEGSLDGMLSRDLLEPAELQRLEPDVVIMQRRIDEPRLEKMRQIHRFSSTFKVLDLDYYPAGLANSASLNGAGVDIHQSIRKALSYVDRLVVSTPALAERFQGAHPDVRVAESRLGPAWALPLAARAANPRPRIACIMDMPRHMDLPLIETVVKTLASDVDWIFLGKAPVQLRGLARESYPDIPLDRDVLVALALDLVLLPLNQSEANHCRGNAAILGFGACGVPVISSDLEGMRGPLPVIRVDNQAERWLDEIRRLIASAQGCLYQGDALRSQVVSHWIHTPDTYQAWLRTWLPA
jgi:GT2 family glycosyltransferase